MGDDTMKDTDFAKIMDGLGQALDHAKGVPSPNTRETKVAASRSFVAETRRKAGLTQAEFAKATGASLGTVRKWERGERTPSGAAGMLVRIMARDPKLVIEEAGLGKMRDGKRAA
jgi:putative transcriptional regulator